MRYQQFASLAYCGALGPVCKMASQQEKAFCVLRFEVSRSMITVRREFRARFRKDAWLRVGTGRPARPRTQHDCHHDTKVKPVAVTTVIELLMMGGKTPETCWAVNKRQDNKLQNCCILLVIYLNFAYLYRNGMSVCLSHLKYICYPTFQKNHLAPYWWYSTAKKEAADLY
jgi:hypothetical protein